MSLSLTPLDGQFSIHRMQPGTVLPEELFREEFYSVVKTTEELSIVCSDRLELISDKVDRGWNCIKVIGPLDFGLTGILAGISHVLAEAKISIFAVSSFDTDYLLVRSDLLAQALDTLHRAGYTIC